MGGAFTVLVMDDADIVRNLLATMIKEIAGVAAFWRRLMLLQPCD